MVAAVQHNGSGREFLDDAPPFALNREALNKAIRMALILNLSLVNEIHIARKQDPLSYSGIPQGGIYRKDKQGP